MNITKLFKRDKRTCLEHEIDAALCKMSDYDNEDDLLMEAINRALEKMEHLDPGSEEYNKILDCVETLCKSKKDIRTSYPELAEAVETLCKAKTSIQTRRLNANTVATLILGAAELVLVLYYEQASVITSKAFQWIKRGRV